MAQITTGIRAVLSHPVVYEAFQAIMRSDRRRAGIVRDYVRPFPGMRILDLGCGTAQILEALPPDVAYVGYDMSAEYIEAARQKFGGRGTFHCRLLEQTEVAQLEPFELVLGLGVLHHLDDAMARQFMSIAKAALGKGGRIYTVDPCFAPGQNPIARFLIARDRGQHVRDCQSYLGLTAGLGAEVRGTLVHQTWIPYTRWHMECLIPRTAERIAGRETDPAREGQ